MYLRLQTGNYTLRIRATPMMQSVVYDATKKVLNPDNTDTQFKTVYDKWLHAFPNSDKTQPRYIVCVYHLQLI